MQETNSRITSDKHCPLRYKKRKEGFEPWAGSATRTCWSRRAGERRQSLLNKELKARFVNVRVEKSNAIMLQGMEGSTLGVWVAHGEGRCFWPDDAVKEEAMRQNCVALKYVDDDNNVTMEYPMNPNGSEGAVVGLTSPYGHLCMMPHPERLFMKYQLPYWAEEWESPVSPWLKVFQNAREWCERQWCVC